MSTAAGQDRFHRFWCGWGRGLARLHNRLPNGLMARAIPQPADRFSVAPQTGAGGTFTTQPPPDASIGGFRAAEQPSRLPLLPFPTDCRFSAFHGAQCLTERGQCLSGAHRTASLHWRTHCFPKGIALQGRGISIYTKLAHNQYYVIFISARILRRPPRGTSALDIYRFLPLS